MIRRPVRRDRPDRADAHGQDGVWQALQGVDDPEYPGVSIVDLGLVDRVQIDGRRVEVDLVPTYSGCPALSMIASDVRAAVGAVDGVGDVEVRFVAEPVWTPERIAPGARASIGSSFGIAVAPPGQPATCPRCGADALVEQSAFGPVRCRSIHRCRSCGEIIEAFR
jgi:ring-1,2-phenylacetyl-CoA epoxidase subunit PaaD